MPTNQIEEVFTHFAQIKQEALAIGADMEARRVLLDRYFALNAEVMATRYPRVAVALPRGKGYWILPAGRPAKRRLLYIHGGSWVSGSINGYQAFVEKIAEAAKAAVLFVDYALAPENPYPAGLDDCISALQWLRNHGPDGPSDAEKLFIAGDSAGGNLALSTLLRCKQDGIALPDAVLAISPCTDLTASGETMQLLADADPILVAQAIPILAELYTRQQTATDDPGVSPLFGDLSGLPPLMLQTGEVEVLLDDSRRFAEKVEAVGGDVWLDLWPQMPHVFQGFAPYLPQANRALENIAVFYRRY